MTTTKEDKRINRNFALYLLEELNVRSYALSKYNGDFHCTNFCGLTKEEQLEILTNLFRVGFIKINM